MQIKSLTEVPVDHAVWKEIEEFHWGRPVPTEIRSLLRADRDLLLLANEEAVTIGGLRQRLEEFEKLLSERTTQLAASRYSLQDDSSIDSQETPPSTPSPPVANYTGILSGLVHRWAEIEEAEIRSLVSTAIAVFARPDIIGNFSTKLEGYAFLRDQNTNRTAGLARGDLPRALERIRDEERRPTPDPVIHASATAIWAALGTIAANPRQAVEVRDATSRQLLPEEKIIRIAHCEETFSIERPHLLLHAIKTACRYLAAKYRWAEEGALSFIALFGGSAIVKAQATRFVVRTDLKCMTRIELTLDPTLSPDEVKRLYAHARRQVLPHHKEVSEAHLALAGEVFTGTSRPVDRRHPRYEERFWSDHYQAWQAKPSTPAGRNQNPVKFAKLSQFRRAAEQTRERLLQPNITMPANLGPVTLSLDVYRKQRGKRTIPL